QWFRKPADFDEWHYLAQLMQARAITLAIEWLRAHMPRCMGVLYWQINDCWAGHSWSAIDCAGRPKLLWYATRRAYAPRLLTIQPVEKKRPTLFVVNDSDEAWRGTVRLRRMAMSGTLLAEAEVPFSAEPRVSITIADLRDALGKADDSRGEFLVADSDGRRALRFFEHDRTLRYPAPQLTTELTRAGDVWRLTVQAETLLRDLTLRGGMANGEWRIANARGDNCVTLLPGEMHVFEIESRSSLERESLSKPPALWCANHFGMK
ncbi:MAG: glycoside hydrolase family 2 protein, partial [Phycisphaerae bacterium]|nr:glycoside hydrolase family 2 protein [Phycisphaerae bacterium]